MPPAVATLLPAACANATALELLGSSDGTEAPLLRRLAGRGSAACAPRQQLGGTAWGPAGGCTVPLPIPDFSMPFNVACFTSTLLAILAGGVANVALR